MGKENKEEDMKAKKESRISMRCKKRKRRMIKKRRKRIRSRRISQGRRKEEGVEGRGGIEVVEAGREGDEIEAK